MATATALSPPPQPSLIHARRLYLLPLVITRTYGVPPAAYHDHNRNDNHKPMVIRLHLYFFNPSLAALEIPTFSASCSALRHSFLSHGQRADFQSKTCTRNSPPPERHPSPSIVPWPGFETDYNTLSCSLFPRTALICIHSLA